MVNLVAVQAELYPEDYLSYDSFRRKIMALTEEAVAGLAKRPTLVAFPEATGFPLLLLLENPEASRHTKVVAAALRSAQQSWRELLGAVWRYRALPLRAFYAQRSLAAFEVYHDVFAEAARTFGVTLVAGSSFLPHIEQEAVRGLHVADARVRNTAFTFAPTGTLLGRSSKLHLTPGLESHIGLSRGNLNDLQALKTPLGTLGVAICLDAFYSSVLERLDALGVQIVVQPSANHAPWDRAWPGDPELSEGEAWLGHGLRAQLQNRLHVQVGVNPMLVGEVWDLRPQGRSNIVVNERYFPNTRLEGYPGLLAIADNAVQAAFVKTTLELKRSVGVV